jgi:hypothetical protein
MQPATMVDMNGKLLSSTLAVYQKYGLTYVTLPEVDTTPHKVFVIQCFFLCSTMQLLLAVCQQELHDPLPGATSSCC